MESAGSAGRRKRCTPDPAPVVAPNPLAAERRRAALAELRSYIGLSSTDAELIARFRPAAEPHFAAIADDFQAFIRMHDGARAILKDPRQELRLRASLQAWLGELLAGVYDDAWVERQAQIGETHVRVGLELRYTLAAMSRVCVSLQSIAADALREDAASTRLAITRACDLALAIMLESYSDDRLARVERARAGEQESMREQLGQRERLLGDVLEAAEVALLGFDGQCRLTVANQKAVELTGYAQEELARADVFALLFGDRGPEMRAALLSVAEGAPVEIEAEARIRSGNTRLVRWRASAHEGDGRAGTRAVVLVGTDVTRERELERRARVNERLAAAGALAAGLAHEIRNPLNGANLHVSVLDRALSRAPGVSPAAREATDVLRAEIRRLSALVTDFLEVARPKPLTRVMCDVSDIARAVRTLLLPEAESRRVGLHVEAGSQQTMAEVDAERVKQLLVNLVRNALEAVREGGRVVIRARRLPRDVEIDVVDDGPGIPDPGAPIFDAFYTTKDRGTGLGLSIVQRIVSDHGGDVSFVSRPGSTTFTVRLPVGAG